MVANKFYRIIWAFFGFVAFILVFNSAYISGDDFEHVAGRIFAPQYIPYQFPGWVPNRILDQWGRGLTSLFIDQIYFFILPLTGNPLVLSYKLVSAVSYAIFYMLAINLFSMITKVDEIEDNLWKNLSMFFIGVMCFYIFPWKNQGHLICYQIPALLGFYILQKLTNLNQAIAKNENWYWVVLIYVSAFTMESVNLTFILSFIFFVIFFLSSRKCSVSSSLQSMSGVVGIAFLLNLVALLITVFFSERIRVQKPSATFFVDFYDRSGPIVIWLKHYPGLLLGLVVITLFIYQVFIKKSIGKNVLHDIQSYILIFIAAFFSTYIVSLKSGTNYFQSTNFPWGDLFLIGKISFCAFFIALMSAIFTVDPKVKSIISVIYFIITTFLLYHVFTYYRDMSLMARAVNSVYDNILANQGGDVIVKEFNSDEIPMPIRPLPSKTSPDWFNNDFSIIAKKYYGLDHVNIIYR